MKFIFQLVCLCATLLGSAQETDQIFIKAGSEPSEVLTPGKIYRFPQFVPGTVFFRDGTVASAKFNYNFLNAEVEFIDPKGDTLAIAKPQQVNIKSIKIDTADFVFANGYLEKVIEIKNGRLLQRQLFVRQKRQKIGGYEQPSETSAIDSYSSYVLEGQIQLDLKVRENVTLQKRTIYFIGDQYDAILVANKKNLLRIFSKQKSPIEEYLKTNEIDFAKLSDLKKLFAYLQTL